MTEFEKKIFKTRLYMYLMEFEMKLKFVRILIKLEGLTIRVLFSVNNVLKELLIARDIIVKIK